MKQIRRDEHHIADRLDETASQLEYDAEAMAGGGGYGTPLDEIADRYRQRANAAVESRRDVGRLGAQAKAAGKPARDLSDLTAGYELGDWLVRNGWTPPANIEVSE
ncbi:hypothetical protein [Gordonia sp. WA4-43]|uniref:hypothetical protein n=1 Tax=Gordonia sp. WA4-43 TaxID=2878678 RepID=UPI001CFC2BAD|nr:hypothetical protein [Gordonia sp. WA4-43]UCZ88627.1 hypothetical protein LEL84_16275 [Gordonia sp. WA4-43]